MKATRGIRNNNPGNIDRHVGVRWQGQAADQSGDRRFVVFDSPKWGIRAIARILITYQDARDAADGSKIDTIREIIARWAPPAENDTGAYATHVATLTRIGVDQTIDVYDYATMKALVAAIITHENGAQPYDDATLDAGLKLAGIDPPRPPIARRADVLSTAGAGIATLAGVGVEAIQTALPQAVQTAQPLAAIAPEWVKPLLFGVAAALVIVALWKQVQAHKADR